MIIEGIPKKRKHSRHGGCAIHVIIPINQYLLLSFHRAANALNSLVHILHQKGIVKVGRLRSEKFSGIIKGDNSTLNEKINKNISDAELLFYGLKNINRRGGWKNKLLGHRVFLFSDKNN